MKKFFAGQQNGVFAQAIKAADVQGKMMDEMVSDALSNGKMYAVTSNDKALKEELANGLQAMFMKRVNTLVDAALELDSMDALMQMREDGKLARDVFEYVEDTIKAKQTENNVPWDESAIAPLVIEKGINMSEAQVMAMLATKGLTVGSPCKTSMGEGTALGFEVTRTGTIVAVKVNGTLHKFMITAVEGKVQTKSEESVSTMKTQVNVASEESKNMVDAAIRGEVPAYELTAEEREQMAELKLQQDLVAFGLKKEARTEKASEVANSSAAQALLALVGKPAQQAQAPQEMQAVSQGAPVVAPAQGSARQAAQNAGVNATQNRTQNNGGNVQMANTTQTQGAKATNVAGAFGGQTVTGTAVRQAGGLTLDAAALAQGQAVQGWAGITSMISAIELDEYMGRGANGGRDFVWYVAEAAKYEGQLMMLEEFKAAGYKNEALGITDIKFYSPQAIASLRNREARVEDFLVVEVFFGMTSYEFMFRRGTFNRDGVQKPYIYSSNIGRKQANSGTWYCEYISSRRTDKLTLVKQADGKIREARFVFENGQRVVHKDDAAFAFEVGGDNWINVAPNYGIKIGQAPFIQLMLLVDELSGLKAAREQA